MSYSLSAAIDAAIWLMGIIAPGLMVALGVSVGATVILWIYRQLPDPRDLLR